MITQFPMFMCTYLHLLYTGKEKAHFLDDENSDFSLQISPTPSPQAMNSRMEKVEMTLNKIMEFLERGNQPNVFASPMLQPAAPTQPASQPAAQASQPMLQPAAPTQPMLQPIFPTQPASQPATLPQCEPQSHLLPSIMPPPSFSPQVLASGYNTPLPHLQSPEMSLTNEDIESLLSDDSFHTPISPHLTPEFDRSQELSASGHQQPSVIGLVSPKRVMVRFPGRAVGSLRKLTTELALQCVFGQEVLARSSVSGRNNTCQFDPEKLKYIKTIVQGRSNMNDMEFESVWIKCMESLKKKFKEKIHQISRL